MKVKGALFVFAHRDMKEDAMAERKMAIVNTGAGTMSFGRLVSKLSPTLKRITRKLNGHFSFMNDEDLFQEALIHLWSRFRAGALDDKTDSYMLQGCYFHLKNYIRKVQDSVTVLSLNVVMDEGGDQLEEILPAHDAGSYDQVEGVLLLEALEASGLNPRERDILFLSLEGMTTREIGKKLGISHVSVVKARSKIRERYCKLNGIAALPAAEEKKTGRARKLLIQRERRP